MLGFRKGTASRCFTFEAVPSVFIVSSLKNQLFFIIRFSIIHNMLLFTHHYPARCFGMNMPKSRDIQAKMPSPKVIYASNESKSVLARNLEECRDNDKNSQSVFLSFKCILARNCEGTEQLRTNNNYTSI